MTKVVDNNLDYYMQLALKRKTPLKKKKTIVPTIPRNKFLYFVLLKKICQR